MYLCLVEGLVKAEAVGNLLNGRIPQHHLAPADHHRHIRNSHMKVVQQTLNIGVTVEINKRVWMAVAYQEFFDAECTGAMIRPHHDDISKPLGDQFYSAGNESPHDDLADLAVGLHQSDQVFAIQLDHFARFPGATMNKHGAAREHVAFAGELSRSIHRDKLLGCAGWQDHLQLTCGDDEEWHHTLPRFEEHLSCLDQTQMTMHSNPLNLSRGQGRKYPLSSGRKRQRDRKSCISHGC